ncbi:MAG: fumarylacetoacetase [Acidimicrobiia bacterium]|nr:fumarylacetoacetase [Acidimicrobiia bacterium]
MIEDPTVDAALGSWVPVPPESQFPIQNLPYGIFRRPGDRARAGVAIGNRILDLDVIAEAGLFDKHAALPWGVFAHATLNQFMALGRPTWQAVRRRVSELLSFDNREIRDTWGLAEKALVPQPETEMLLPFAVADFIDFYSSREHATNLGNMFRPGGDALLPNWLHLPVGYHGRAGTIVASGTPIVRPRGQVKLGDSPPQWIPTRKLDFELEVGFVVGIGNELGSRITTDAAHNHIFGMMLVNDWSARDIQAFEYQPLGPFLSKSFATSVAPWVVSMDAMAPYRVAAPAQDPPVQMYLMTDEDWGLDLNLDVGLLTREMMEHERAPEIISRVNFRDMYWTAPQQLAHATVNGAAMRTGDLCASGTVSGSDPGSYGSLIELTWNGDVPIELAGGAQRTFLEDGDSVVIRGWCGGDGRPKIGFGEVRGTIFPAEEG